MTAPPLSVRPDASLEEAANILASSEASDLMVADAEGCFLGVVSEGDLIRAVLPDVDEIYEAGGSVDDAMAAFVAKGRMLAERNVAPYVIADPLTVAPDDHAAVAAAALIEHQIRRLPVVQDGRLVGTVSRSDVVDAVLEAGSKA